MKYVVLYTKPCGSNFKLENLLNYLIRKDDGQALKACINYKYTNYCHTSQSPLLLLKQQCAIPMLQFCRDKIKVLRNYTLFNAMQQGEILNILNLGQGTRKEFIELFTYNDTSMYKENVEEKLPSLPISIVPTFFELESCKTQREKFLENYLMKLSWTQQMKEKISELDKDPVTFYKTLVPFYDEPGTL